MEQLIMRWTREGCGNTADICFPDGVTYRSFDGSVEDVDRWLEIVAHGLTDGVYKRSFFDDCMRSHGNLEYDKLFMVFYKGIPAATITVICDYEKKEGYIHMVACKSDFRGLGIGTQMNNLAVRTLLDSGMNTAYLTTDDFRIPAIKSYLRAGFTPELSTEDFKIRWEKILNIIH